MSTRTRQSLAQPDLQFGNEAQLPASARQKLDRLTQSVRSIIGELQKIQQAMAGGSTGQVLEKTGGGDYEATWENAQGGTITGATNLGPGLGLFKSLDVSTLGFRTLVAGTNISLVPSPDAITIVAGGGGEGSGTVTSVGINSADLTVTGSPITDDGSIELEIAEQAVTYAKMQFTASDAVILGRGFAEGHGQLEEQTLSQVLDFLGAAQQGDILFRGASLWQYLTPDTAGKFLQTHGPAADPTWEATGTATTLRDPLILGLDYDLVSGTGWADVTIACLLRAPLLTNLATSWKFGLNVTLGPMLVTACVVKRVLRDMNTYVDSTPVTFGGSLTPTLATGLNLSDEIALPVDEDHDYVILLHFDAAVSGSASLPISAGDGSDLASTSAAGDHTADTDYSAFTFSIDSNVSFYGAWVVRGNIGSITAVWRASSGVPSNALGVDGDFYLDSLTGDVYEKIAGIYAIVANIKGADGASSSAPVSDLLLHFNGVNGATATVDSGSHAFTVTRIGAAILQNTQVKFGTTATENTFANGWSVPDDPALRFGANDFSIDFWIYPTNWVTGSNQENAMMTKWNVSTEWYFTNNSSAGPAFYYNGGFPNFGLTQVAIPLNAWTHVELIRTGNFIKLYLNGVLSGTPINIGNTVINGTAEPVRVGAGGVAGQAMYMDEVRIINYRGNFTPPISEYSQ